MTNFLELESVVVIYRLYPIPSLKQSNMKEILSLI